MIDGIARPPQAREHPTPEIIDRADGLGDNSCPPGSTASSVCFATDREGIDVAPVCSPTVTLDFPLPYDKIGRAKQLHPESFPAPGQQQRCLVPNALAPLSPYATSSSLTQALAIDKAAATAKNGMDSDRHSQALVAANVAEAAKLKEAAEGEAAGIVSARSRS